MGGRSDSGGEHQYGEDNGSIMASRPLTFELGHTCRNHFAVLDCRDGVVLADAELQDLAERLCSSAIADDMLVLEPSVHADVRLRIFGSDRREAEFCGNGTIYTAAKIGRELQRSRVSIETASGTKAAVDIGYAWKIEVGEVSPLDAELAAVGNHPVIAKPLYGLLRAGEPHLVMFHPKEIDGFHVPRYEFEEFCRPLRDITPVDGGISITMIFEIGFRSVLIRTFERGARRHTFSCGTGSVSAIAAVFGTPRNGSQFHVCAPGGGHNVSYENDRWYLAALPQPIGIGTLEGDMIQLPLNGLSPYLYASAPTARIAHEETCR